MQYLQTGIIPSTLKGISQIMLQENILTGLFFLAGIFYGSVNMGFAALLAALVGTLTAIVFRFNKANIQSGLYGFSAALTGVALMLFFKPVPLIWGCIVLGSILASVLQHFFILKNIPVYTFPFVLVTWILLFTGSTFHPEYVLSSSDVSEYELYYFAIRGYGQVIFQSSIISGLLFFIGVLISSPIAAFYGLFASVLSGGLALIFYTDSPEVAMGLLSFNAVLCAIVFAGKTITDGILVFLSVLIALAVSILFLKYQLPQLTFPFVAASCTLTLVKRTYLNAQ